MSANLHQIFLANPTTTFQASDEMYLVRSPFGPTDDFAFTYSSLIPVNTKGDLFTWSTAATKLGVGANGTILTADSTAATGLKWTTATYPATTTINQILYSSAANTVAGLATANDGVLITGATGIPSISSTLPAAVQGNITALGTIASGTWQGTVIGPVYGGTGLSSYITGDTLYASGTNVLTTLAGNTTTAKMFLSQTGDGINSAAPLWETIDGGDVTGAALTKVDDTNVTLTLGGTPTTALLQATSITAGWTGQLSMARGGTNANLTAANGAIPYSTASAFALLAHPGGTNQALVSSASGAPHYTTAAYPDLATAGNLMYSPSTNIWSGLAPSANTILSCNGSSAPTWISTVPVSNGGTGTTTTFTTGSVIFAGASGVYSQDNANFFWDDTNNRLGILTTGPVDSLDVNGGAIVRSGLTVGFNSAASADTILLGDADFKFDYNGGDPIIFFQATDSDYFQMQRSSNMFRWVIGNVEKGTLNSSGDFAVTGKIGVGIASPGVAADIKGVVNVSDGTKTYPAGIASETNTSLINFGINDSRFGSQTNADQGGFLRVDTRSGHNAVAFYLRAATDTSATEGPYMVPAVGGRINFALSNNSLFTTDTDGFPYLPTCAGAPTGTPTALTGLVATVYDSTNNKLYVYSGGWKSVTLA